MALNACEREILVKVRELLINRNENYICSAIVEAWLLLREGNIQQAKCYREAYAHLLAYVMEQIKPTSYFHHWQIANGLFVSTAQSRKDRINWISWMLGELPDAPSNRTSRRKA